AGHVDHGKTELVKALTGIDTDRLPEEKARGLSIDLGFAYQPLSDNRTLGFVDVPGHEKFIRNMLAGVGGIDLGLLVVAADDGVMPQTREHFAILDLLGINQCVVAITKIDRVDDERILQVQVQVEALLSDAGHKQVAVFPVCAPDNQGVDALKGDLDKRAHGLSIRPHDGHFRMAIDRVFTLKGVGLVVTGMVIAGAATIDDSLVLSYDGSQVRMRGIRAHNEVSDHAQAGQRCAINIVGRGVSESLINRGHWLMHSNLYAPTRRIDVDLRVLDTESRPLKHWTPTHLHIGADHLSARVAVLSGGTIAEGDRGLVQLVLAQDAFVVHGDRFVLRDQSAQRTIAGGHVIDPFSPKRGRARPSRIEALHAMNKHDSRDVLDALTKISEIGVPLNQFSIAHNLPRHQTDDFIDSLSLRRIGRHPQERIFSSTQWQGLLNRIEQAIGDFHLIKPELPGAGLKNIQLVIKPHVESSILEAATAYLVSEKRLGRRGARFHLPPHLIDISEHDRQLWSRAAASLAPNSGSPLSLHQAAEGLDIDIRTLEKSLKNAVKIGEMVLVAKNRYLPTSYLARLGWAAEELAERSVEGIFTVAEYCKQTTTGRNFAIHLLEYFDRIGFTARVGNNRRVRRSAATLFAVDDEA
ncbi:MAG: selenocysteine-specific elongation factor, partial [Gammaproteobacteria bacterium]